MHCGPLKAAFMVFVCTETPDNGELLQHSSEPDTHRASITCSISACFSIATEIFHGKKFLEALKTAKLF